MSRVVERAYAEVRRRIVSGDYPTGFRLKEEELAAEIGVSRTPVREALRRLNSEHLVQFVPKQGACVASWTEAEVDELFILRSLLESYGAELAADRISAEQIRQLGALADEMDDAVGVRVRSADSDRRFLALNNEFHRLILDASGSERLKRMLATLVEIPVMLRTLDRYSERDLLRSCRQHHDLVAALKAGDGAWAASIMRAHLLAARAAYLGSTVEKLTARA